MNAASDGDEDDVDASIILDEGQVYVWDPGAILDEYEGDALRVVDGEIQVLKTGTRNWVRVEPIKPTTAGRIRGIKGSSNGAD